MQSVNETPDRAAGADGLHPIDLTDGPDTPVWEPSQNCGVQKSNHTNPKEKAMSPIRIGLALTSLLVALFGVTILLTADPPAAVNGNDKVTVDKPFKPMMNVEQLMEGQEQLFKSIKDGIADKSWDESKNAAWMLAELANTNQYHHKDVKYRELAQKMADDTVELAKLLGKHKADESKAQFTKVSQSCKSCHDAYKKQW